MSREDSIEVDTIRIGVGSVPTVTPSKTKGSSVLRGNLSVSKRINGSNRSSEAGQQLGLAVLLNIDVGGVSFVYVVGVNLAGSLIFRHFIKLVKLKDR